MNTLGILYTMGYTGRTPDDIAQAAIGARAVVVDVRLSPRSRVARWNGATLEAFLERNGVRYEHIPPLGNINYKNSKPIELCDQKAGAALLCRLLKNGNCLILCACKDLDDCHRKTVAEVMKRDYGVSVVHITQRKDETHEPRHRQVDLF